MFLTDKMPKNCSSCPCVDKEYGVCNIDYDVVLSEDDRPKECPLQEVKHAHWVVERYCSHCDCDVHDYGICANLPKYCPHCGARMDEVVEDA